MDANSSFSLNFFSTPWILARNETIFKAWEQGPDIKFCFSFAQFSVKGATLCRTWSDFSLNHQPINLNLHRNVRCELFGSPSYFEALWDLMGIPIVCRYALVVVGIWLGSSALLFLQVIASYSLTTVSSKLSKVHEVDQGPHYLRVSTFYICPQILRIHLLNQMNYWTIGTVLITCARKPQAREWAVMVSGTNTSFSLETFLSVKFGKIKKYNRTGGAFSMFSI